MSFFSFTSLASNPLCLSGRKLRAQCLNDVFVNAHVQLIGTSIAAEYSFIVQNTHIRAAFFLSFKLNALADSSTAVCYEHYYENTTMKFAINKCLTL